MNTSTAITNATNVITNPTNAITNATKDINLIAYFFVSCLSFIIKFFITQKYLTQC